MESQNLEKKSLKILKLDQKGNLKTIDDKIIKTCVAFANSRGGKIIIGIEDRDDIPEKNQKIENKDLANQIIHNITALTQNVGANGIIKVYENGGEAIEINIISSISSIASTSDGRYFMRVADNSMPLMPNELSQLLTDKPSFEWETKITKNLIERADDDKKIKFLQNIKSSKKIRSSIMQKSNEEILEHYFLIDGQYLTNLGTLWIGSRNDRARLSYSPTIRFIKYDENENITKQLSWEDFYLNPQELIEVVINEIPDLKEGIEIPDGMFRKFIPNYPEVVIRELLTNALVHRPYTQKGEIFIFLYQDRLEIINPGLFPLGITPQNFLHKQKRRNEKMAQLFSDLGLMERAGSGIDKVYEVLLINGKEIPEVLQDEDSTTIVIRKKIINSDVINLIERANKEFELNPRELTSLALIAENNSLSVLEFSNKLGLDSNSQQNIIKSWIGKLIKLDIIKQKGRTKATEYFVNPEFLKILNFKGKTNLKRIEGHRLKELIREDLSIYELSLIKDIHHRIGSEIPLRKIKHELDKMTKKNDIIVAGSNRWTKYSLNKN